MTTFIPNQQFSMCAEGHYVQVTLLSIFPHMNLKSELKEDQKTVTKGAEGNHVSVDKPAFLNLCQGAVVTFILQEEKLSPQVTCIKSISRWWFEMRTQVFLAAKNKFFLLPHTCVQKRVNDVK